MMGSKARSFDPIDGLTLADLVPADHFYRHLERSLDLSFVRGLVADCYAAGGRPSIDLVVFFKLQLVMFFEGIRSERQLMELAADRLSVRWYLGYDLAEPLPDHSSLTRIRDRFGIDVFRRFFDAIVEQCQQAGLVWGRELYIDATTVQANADLDSLVPRFAVDAHLGELFTIADGPDELAQELLEDTGGLIALGQDLTAPAFQSVCTQAEARHDWIARIGRPNRALLRGAYQRTADFRVSTTDQDATPMPLAHGGTHLGYQDHYVVDGGRARIILGTLVAPAEVQENQPALDLLWRARFRWKLWPWLITGDAKYGTVENIVAIETQGIRAFVPLSEVGHRPGRFRDTDFTYDPAADVHHCPGEVALTFLSQCERTQRRIYQAPATACRGCKLREQCTTSARGRRISRSFNEAYLERVRGYHPTEWDAKALRKRRVWVEPLFAEAKQWHGLERFRLRGLIKVNGEALLIAAGQNLKRLLTWSGWSRLAMARRHSWAGGFGTRFVRDMLNRLLVSGPYGSRA